MEKKKSYSELLRSPMWQKKRLEIMERDNFTCQHCGCNDMELQVHHKVYHEDLNPWEYDNDDLITLCGCCHGIETIAKRDMYKTLKEVSIQSKSCGFSEQLIFAALIYIGDELREMKDSGKLRNSDNSIIADIVFRYPMLRDAKILYDNGVYPSAQQMERINEVLPDFFTKFTKMYGARINK